MRNELRQPDSGAGEPYDWYTWYNHTTTAASIIHRAAPGALIYFGGLGFDTTMEPIPLGLPLNGTNGTSTEGKVAYFDPSKFPFKNKIVLELHKYDHSAADAPCSDLVAEMYTAGYSTLNLTDPAVKYHFPMMMTEFGFNQVNWNATSYSECLIELMGTWKPSGWMQWDLSGSYMIRQGSLDLDETWGLLNHNWSAVRSQEAIENRLWPMIEATLL